MSQRGCHFAIAVCFLGTACCFAAEAHADADSRPTIYVGAGAILSTKPYVGMDAKVYPVPMFGYEGKRLYLRGIRGGYRLIMGEGWSIGPVIQPRFDGYEEDDSSALAGMADRNVSLEAGVGFLWLTDYGLWAASFVTDVLGEHDGQEVEVSWTARLERQRWDFVPSVGLRWRSDNVIDYYYGVRRDEANADRPPYEPDDVIDPFVRLVVRLKLTKRWSLLGAIQYEWLGSEISDSPIVDDDYGFSLMGGAMYSF